MPLSDQAASQVRQLRKEEAIKQLLMQRLESMSGGSMGKSGGSMDNPNHVALLGKIDDLLSQSEFEEHVFWEKELVVCCKLPCGFTLTGRGVVSDPRDFNLVTGRKVARDQIESQLWQLEAYREHLARSLARSGDSDTTKRLSKLSDTIIEVLNILKRIESAASTYNGSNVGSTDFMLGKISELSQAAIKIAESTPLY